MEFTRVFVVVVYTTAPRTDLFAFTFTNAQNVYDPQANRVFIINITYENLLCFVFYLFFRLFSFVAADVTCSPRFASIAQFAQLILYRFSFAFSTHSSSYRWRRRIGCSQLVERERERERHLIKSKGTPSKEIQIRKSIKQQASASIVHETCVGV